MKGKGGAVSNGPGLRSAGSALSSGKMTACSMEEDEGVQTQFQGDCQRHRMVWTGPGRDRGGRRAAAPRGMFEEASASELLTGPGRDGGGRHPG